ncbi:hypothetical protein pipiens_016942 [Culex pipiens pipiens]|uniref:Cyclin-dependent kinases regulatory subunit n=1 Tax=Culex pipiens pipiens TaxID=38569 RepID=A0ABD1CIX8_CULPP
MSVKDIYYSDKYFDDEYEYRHVVLPKDIAKLVPKTHLMTETEWRSIGVQQSRVRDLLTMLKKHREPETSAEIRIIKNIIR